MNTKFVMILSTLFMGLLGISASFFPKEILSAANLPSSGLPVLLIQVTGALYAGFAILNWMAKGVVIGGIYAKPVCLGNLVHFFVAAMALIKAALSQTGPHYIWVAAGAYAFFAVLFGWLFFTSPVKST